MSRAQIHRCSWCVKYDLPCGDLTHDNVLARYVPLMSTTNLHVSQLTDVPVVPAGEPVVRQSHPAEHYERAQRRADRATAVAIVIMTLVALAVGIVLFLAAFYLDAAILEPAAGWDHQPFAPTPTPYPAPTP